MNMTRSETLAKFKNIFFFYQETNNYHHYKNSQFQCSWKMTFLTLSYISSETKDRNGCRSFSSIAADPSYSVSVYSSSFEQDCHQFFLMARRDNTGTSVLLQDQPQQESKSLHTNASCLHKHKLKTQSTEIQKNVSSKVALAEGHIRTD